MGVHNLKSSKECLKIATATFEKYKKNKTLVSPDDLKGKYKVPFQKLRRQLADELSEYLLSYSLEGLTLIQDGRRFDNFVSAVNRIYKESDMARRIGLAVFNELDMLKAEHLAKELKSRIHKEAWMPYLDSYMCLYITQGCFQEDNPQAPRIYNSLVDKFFDTESGEWIMDEAAERPAILFYIKGDK